MAYLSTQFSVTAEVSNVIKVAFWVYDGTTLLSSHQVSDCLVSSTDAGPRMTNVNTNMAATGGGGSLELYAYVGGKFSQFLSNSSGMTLINVTCTAAGDRWFQVCRQGTWSQVKLTYT